MDYWDRSHMPRLQRIIFDNTLSQQEAVELVKTGEGRVDLVTELNPLDTLRVAESPFAAVIKNRGSLVMVYGIFNMLKAGSPWRDVRLRQAVNMAIHREDFIRYATKGNGVIVPALLPAKAFGYDPDLAPYAFEPVKARTLRREAGYPDGLAVTLIAPLTLEVQATVISKMLDQVGFQVERQMLDPVVYNQKTERGHLGQPVEQQAWDIALELQQDLANFPVFMPYNTHALGGNLDWGLEKPELHRLYEQGLRTVDREQQQALIRQMERHTHDQAYFLFLYSPIQLYAVNKAVQFVPHVTGRLIFGETAVTDEHWSVRKEKATGPE